MSRLTELASVVGIPAGAASLTITMFAGCAVAEKAASPHALKDIAHALKDAS